MHFYPRLWIFTLCLQAASALDIEDIQMSKTRFEVNEGDRLLIPCSFKTDEEIQSNDLRVEWGVLTGPNNYYRPIYRVVGSVLEPVTEPNSYEGRAQMFISLIPKGNCSLVLQPILASDSGQYELRLYSEGEVTVNGQKVVVLVNNGTGVKQVQIVPISQVYVLKKKRIDSLQLKIKSRLCSSIKLKEDLSTVEKWNERPISSKRSSKSAKENAASKQRTIEGSDTESCGEFTDFDKHLVTLTKGIKSISTKTGVSTLGLEIIAGVVTGILLMGTVAGIVLCCYFYKGIKVLKKEKHEKRKRERHHRRSKHHQDPREEPEVQQEGAMFEVDTPDPTTSTSPLEQCGYQMASDTTNSTLFGFDMVNSN